MTTIYSNAFFNCYNLEKLYIPKSIKNIGKDAFNFAEIDNIYYSGTKAEWNSISIDSSNNSVLSKAKIHYLGEPHIHEYTQTVVKSTCTAEGKITQKCDCGDIRYTTTAKTPHSFNVITESPATLVKDGMLKKICKNCNYAEKAIIPAIDKIKLSAEEFEYNGGKRIPSVTVTDRTGKLLKKNTDYTVSLPSNPTNTGTYTIKVTFKGQYKASQNLTYKIVLCKPKSLSFPL